MYKKFFVFFFVFVFCVCFVFVVSDSDNSYYFFEFVFYGLFSGCFLVILAVIFGWIDIDYDYLNQIRLVFIFKNTGTLLSYIVFRSKSNANLIQIIMVSISPTRSSS